MNPLGSTNFKSCALDRFPTTGEGRVSSKWSRFGGLSRLFGFESLAWSGSQGSPLDAIGVVQLLTIAL